MSHRRLLNTIGLIILFLSPLALVARQPNILIIQADDLGYDDLSMHGNTCSETPNIDHLGMSSVRFTNFMVNSVCAPTRASLLTGRDFWRTGCEGLHGGKEFLHMDERTFANVFQDAGYTTGMWGKWHSGKSDGYWPWDRGFDEGYYAKLYHYYPSNGYYNTYPEQTVHEGEWSAAVLADYAIDFISRNQDRPFLAYLSFLTCHSTWNAPEQYKARFRREGRTEAFATLLGMLAFMDEEIGRVLHHLEDLGLAEDTIVLFLSDNGPNFSGSKSQKGADVITAEEWKLRNNHGFLGSKSKLWQNGIKSPLFVRWTGKYTPAEVGRLVTVTDIFPTLLDMAGLELPQDNLPLDGRSIASYLEGDLETLDEKQAVFANWHPWWEGDQYDPVQDTADLEFDEQRLTLVNERYKYLQNEYATDGSPVAPDKRYLLDLETDPLEQANVIKSQPELASRLKGELKKWYDDLLKSPHAFTPTVFQIGWKGKVSSEILAFGPSRTVGVKNNSHRIDGWDVAGDLAEYQINVHQSGRYRISVGYTSRKLSKGTIVQASCAGRNIQHALQNAKSESLGELFLEKGRQVFRFEILEADVSDKPDLSFTTFQFDRNQL